MLLETLTLQGWFTGRNLLSIGNSSVLARDAFHIEVQNYGMACQPSQSSQPPCIVSRKLSKAVLLYFDLFRVRVLFLLFRFAC